MQNDPNTGQPQLNKTEARAGVTLGAIRWVLILGIACAIIFMIAARSFGMW
jgi:hypothetical protein